jgi:hypothetical protein
MFRSCGAGDIWVRTIFYQAFAPSERLMRMYDKADLLPSFRYAKGEREITDKMNILQVFWISIYGREL